MLRLVCSALLVVALAASPAHADWTYDSGENWGFELPDDWRAMSRDEIREGLRALRGVVGGRLPTYNAGFTLEELDGFDYPYILTQFHKGRTKGIYKDIERKFAVGMKQAERQASRVGRNVGFTVEIGDTQIDRENNRITLETTLELEDIGVVRGISVLRIGSHGVAQLNCYALEADWDDYRPVFERMVMSLAFEDGHRFAESGLAGLVGSPGIVFAVLGIVLGLILVMRRQQRNQAQRHTRMVTDPGEPWPAGPRPAAGTTPPLRDPNAAPGWGRQLPMSEVRRRR